MGNVVENQLASAERSLSAAKVVRSTAVSTASAARWSLRYHALRHWTTSKGMPGWVLALLAGSAAAIAIAMVLIFVLGAGLPLIVVGVIAGYSIAGGLILWVFRPLNGESDSNRLTVRADQVLLAQQKWQSATAALKWHNEDVARADLALRTIRQVMQSDAHKRQAQADRLLGIDPGRLYPDEFERYVADIFTHLGFTATVMGQSGDQGVDVLACKGQLRIAIQAKRHIGSIGNAAVQEVFAGMAHHKCHRCIVVTSSEFTQGAIALAQSTGCVLIGAERIAPLIRGEYSFAGPSPTGV